MMIAITAQIHIAEDELHWQFIRAAGPGGQNVNKVATCVQLRFNVRGCAQLPEAMKARLQKSLTDSGDLIITARQHRTQTRNREAALQRLIERLRAAATPPKPRHKTKVSKAQKRQRLHAKKQRAQTKLMRRSVANED